MPVTRTVPERTKRKTPAHLGARASFRFIFYLPSSIERDNAPARGLLQSGVLFFQSEARRPSGADRLPVSVPPSARPCPGESAAMRQREIRPELMDDPTIDPASHVRALRGLARLNALSRAWRILWPDVRSVVQSLNRPARLLDVASGSGDVPISLARRAAREGLTIEPAACDISERALAAAQSRAALCGIDLNVYKIDVERQELPGSFDIVCCSLFMHHLSSPTAFEVLKRMAGAAGHLLLVSDLRRTRTGLMLAWAASRLVTRSRIVHVDAVRSVRAAFRPDEFAQLAEQAGLSGATVRAAWPQRMLLRWSPA